MGTKICALALNVSIKAFLLMLLGREYLFGLKLFASPESGEVARRGKAAATEGLLPLSRLSFLVAFNPSVILALLG